MTLGSTVGQWLRLSAWNLLINQMGYEAGGIVKETSKDPTDKPASALNSKIVYSMGNNALHWFPTIPKAKESPAQCPILFLDTVTGIAPKQPPKPESHPEKSTKDKLKLPKTEEKVDKPKSKVYPLDESRLIR